jgi:hypothetical protein
MEEVGFGLSRMAQNGGIQFWPDWNGLEGRKSILTWPEGLEWRRSVLAILERLGLADVSFGLPGMAWNVKSRIWPFWNGLETRK